MRLDLRISDLFFNFAPAIEAETPEELRAASEQLADMLTAVGTAPTPEELVEDFNRRL